MDSKAMLGIYCNCGNRQVCHPHGLGERGVRACLQLEPVVKRVDINLPVM